MPRKKSKGNGQGSVYPRKNKDGKITGYLGAYYGPMESVDTSLPKARLSASAN